MSEPRRKHHSHRRRRCPPVICWRTIAFYLTLGLVLVFGAAAHAESAKKACGGLSGDGKEQCCFEWADFIVAEQYGYDPQSHAEAASIADKHSAEREKRFAGC